MVKIILVALLVSSCADFERKMHKVQQLECHPIQATECIGWAKEDTLTIISEEDI